MIPTAKDILGIEPEDLEGKGRRSRRVASASNPLLMRLRLASLLITGHPEYPDALSRITPLQGGIFALFRAVRRKTEMVMAAPDIEIRPGESRYHAVRRHYAQTTAPAPLGGLAAPQEGPILSAPAPRGGLAQGGYVPPFYGLKIFEEGYLSLSQSFLAEGRKEYLSGIEEKPVYQSATRAEDLSVAKPSVYELLTGREKPPKRSD